MKLTQDRQNPTPDYYCTWQTQLYTCDNSGPEMQRAYMTEENLFGGGAAQGWVNFYERARKDLLLVMDDSWDVPVKNHEKHYGSLVLDKGKFPGFYEENNPQKSLERLTERVKQAGWKGLGGWVCAQESPLYPEKSAEEYWIKRLKWCQNAGFSYWKVDWGEKAKDLGFRRMLTRLQKQYAPDIVIEHAMLADAIGFGDVFRTYDVPAIMSIPMTMQKTAECLTHTDGGMINCEDEAYIAAALGCVMGIMRHPLCGNLPGGEPDLSFPAMHRSIKTKTAEILRAVRWHRMAPAFGVTVDDVQVSKGRLTDYWDIKSQRAEFEKWWGFKDGERIEKSAPAAISRGMPLPEIKPDKNGLVPFAVSSKNPNGIISVATLGRTRGREYILPKCAVGIDGGDAVRFGIFGEYDRLIIHTGLKKGRVYIQDIASNEAADITDKVEFADNRLVIDGRIIHNFGTMENGGDTSEPGVVLGII